MLKPVHVIIGTDRPETIPVAYVGDAMELLNTVRAACETSGTIHTNRVEIVLACMALQRRSEFFVTLFRVRDGEQSQIDVDVKGELIQPWPDEFFEINFHLIFHRDE